MCKTQVKRDSSKSILLSTFLAAVLWSSFANAAGPVRPVLVEPVAAGTPFAIRPGSAEADGVLLNLEIKDYFSEQLGAAPPREATEIAITSITFTNGSTSAANVLFAATSGAACRVDVPLFNFAGLRRAILTTAVVPGTGTVHLTYPSPLVIKRSPGDAGICFGFQTSTSIGLYIAGTYK